VKRTARMKTLFSILLSIFLFLLAGCSGTIPTNNTPTITSSPITSSLINVLYTYNVEATDTDGDTLTYTLTSSPTGMAINSSSGVISWTPNTVGDYDVTLKVSDGESFDTQSFIITISLTEIIALSPPNNVSASDGYTDKVRITWDTVSGASHYQVYRTDTLLGAKIAISGWQTGTSYDDISVIPGSTPYYYWVKAATSSSGDNASVYSEYAFGFATPLIPINLPPPYNVSASDILVNKVQITWNTGEYLLPIPTEASHYQVYRANNLLATKTAISGWQTGTSYDDTSVAPWTTYWYWVKAATSSSGGNATVFSNLDTGYAISIVTL